MNNYKFYGYIIEQLNNHLSGKKKLTDEQLGEIGMSLEEDIPWSDDWVSHGYSSHEEWYKAHEDFLNELDEVLNLHRSIPDIEMIMKKTYAKYENVSEKVDSPNIEKQSSSDNADDILKELGL